MNFIQINIKKFAKIFFVSLIANWLTFDRLKMDDPV